MRFVYYRLPIWGVKEDEMRSRMVCWSLVLAFAALGSACSDDSSPATDAAPRSDTSPSTDGGAPPSDAAPDVAMSPLATAKGTLTLNIDLGEPCTMTFTLDGIEDRSAPWLTLGATHSFRTASNVPSNTCPWTTDPREIFFGWSDDGTFVGSLIDGFGAKLGTASVDGDSVTIIVDVTIPAEGGNPGGTITGNATVTLGQSTGDPLHGWRAASTYACGWPKGNAPAFAGSYAPALGDPLPDGTFVDQCGEKVRLHDLLGRYLVLQINQTAALGCPPCALGATGQKAFEEAMSTLGIDTLVVSLLVREYDAGDAPSVEELSGFATSTETSGVALADRGFGRTITASVLSDELGFAQFAYPGYALVAPDGEILHAVLGFNATWADLKSRIEAHAQ